MSPGTFYYILRKIQLFRKNNLILGNVCEKVNSNYTRNYKKKSYKRFFLRFTSTKMKMIRIINDKGNWHVGIIAISNCCVRLILFVHNIFRV